MEWYKQGPPSFTSWVYGEPDATQQKWEVRVPLLSPERQQVVPVNGRLNTVEIIAARFACRLLIGMILHEVF